MFQNHFQECRFVFFCFFLTGSVRLSVLLSPHYSYSVGFAKNELMTSWDSRSMDEWRQPITATGLNSCGSKHLSGPLNRLNAILSLLHPLDRYRTPSAIGSAIGRPLSRPISHPNTRGSPQPPRSKPLRGAQPRDSGAIVSKTPLK